MRNADQRIRPEIHGIEIIVRYPPVHRAHRLKAPVHRHIIKPVILYPQLRPVHQMRPCLLRQIGVLKVGRIVPPRRKYHRMSAGIHIVHCVAQQPGVIPVVLQMIVVKGVGRASPAKLPGNHRIRRPGRHPQIVLQNVPFPILSLDQINSGNMCINAPRWQRILTLRHIAARGKNEIFRHNPIFHNLFFAVNIFDKEIERHDALL